jgi:hypothetical protein
LLTLREQVIWTDPGRRAITRQGRPPKIWTSIKRDYRNLGRES